MLPDEVTEKLGSLPIQSGCYLFRDKQGEVLYVGKAKSLRARVRSYFQEGSSDTRAFIYVLPRLIGGLETFVTSTEKEAAILENSLIKEHKPRLNVKLRDDKEYLNLRLDKRVPWPRLELVRRPAPDGARYFGPFHSATAARRTLHLVEKHFQLRTCSDRELASRKRPCIQYQMKRCTAPCVLPVDRETYGAQVRAVDLFLSGRHDELSSELSERMKDASQRMEFELAALYRDQLSSVSQVRQEQRVVAVSDVCQDVLGMHREGDLVELSVVYVRQGRVVEIFNISHARTVLPDDEVVAQFLREHYKEGGIGSAMIPEEIIVPVLPEGAAGVEEWLSERRAATLDYSDKRRSTKTALFSPTRGPRKKLLDLARENAAHAFAEKRRAAEDIEERLRVVQHKLRLPRLPRLIECCDISHLGGEATVGSVVALKDGAPYKKNYKAYRVRTVSDGDDYAAMFEVLSRRFRRGKDAAEGGEQPGADWNLPDLFVVDGGRGQLGVALTVAQDLGLTDLPLVGLAKERETITGDKMVDRVYLPGQKNPIPLRPNTPELFLLALARDEAHRFANHHRMKLGKKRRLTSRLDEIKGIGPKTRKALLSRLGGLAAIAAASDAELLQVPGVNRRQVAALREALGGGIATPEEPALDDSLPGEPSPAGAGEVPCTDASAPDSSPENSTPDEVSSQQDLPGDPSPDIPV